MKPFDLVELEKLRCITANFLYIHFFYTKIEIENLEMSNPQTRNSSKGSLECQDGIFLPVWTPLEDVSDGDIALRGKLLLIRGYALKQ